MAYPDNASNGIPITPSDSATIPATLGVYVGGAGNLTVDWVAQGASSGKNVTFTAVPVGTVLPIRITKVYATGTTAAALIALY